MVKELEKKQNLKRALYSIPSLLLIAVAAFFLVKGALGVLKIERQSAAKVAGLEEDLDTLSSRKGGLQERIDRLGTDEGLVEEIRRKFGAVREGEYMAVVIETKEREVEDPSQDVWYKRIWHAIIPDNDE